MRVAGLTSGTSVDGIDVAVVDIDEAIKVVASKTVPYPAEVRDSILSVSDAANIARLNFLLGELFAEALQQAGVPLETIELIGSHGQTIFHEGRRGKGRAAGPFPRLSALQASGARPRRAEHRRHRQHYGYPGQRPHRRSDR